MLHFASYNEFLSEQAGSRHPFVGGLVLFLIVAVAILLVV
jgi:hypothetical protein